MQPLAADDVAAALADVAVGAPLNATIELAGPEKMSIAEFVGRFMAASGDKRTVIADPQALYTGAVMDDRGIAPGRPAPRPDAVRRLVRAPCLRDRLAENRSGDGERRHRSAPGRAGQDGCALMPGGTSAVAYWPDATGPVATSVGRFVCEAVEVVSVFMPSGRGKTNRLRFRCAVESPFTSIFYSRCMKNIAVSFYELLIILKKIFMIKTLNSLIYRST